MPHSAERTIAQTLALLVDDFRVCEAELLAQRLRAGGQWNGELEAAWRAELAGRHLPLVAGAIFPLLYVRNNQIPRGLRGFETLRASERSVAPEEWFAALLEMLRALWQKRQIPLAKLSGKLKRNRVLLISTERAQSGQRLVFDAAWRLMGDAGHPRVCAELAASGEWAIYPVVRELIDDVARRHREAGTLPAYWPSIEVRTAIHREELDRVEAAAALLDHCDLSAAETERLRARYVRWAARLRELREKEALHAEANAAYLAIVRGDWLAQLGALHACSRSPAAWEEYQRLRDTYAPAVLGTAEEILGALPREGTYTAWEVGPILPFQPQKALRLRPAKSKVMKVDPEQSMSYALPCLEHYTQEEGLRGAEIVHWAVVRLKEEAYALFNLAPPAEITI